jgi:hypothetical protein
MLPLWNGCLLLQQAEPHLRLVAAINNHLPDAAVVNGGADPASYRIGDGGVGTVLLSRYRYSGLKRFMSERRLVLPSFLWSSSCGRDGRGDSKGNELSPDLLYEALRLEKVENGRRALRTFGQSRHILSHT